MIKDVIFISRGNETFSQHRVRRLARLSAGCFLLPSAESGASFKAQAPADPEPDFLVELFKKD